jgi:hypothetical protein
VGGVPRAAEVTPSEVVAIHEDDVGLGFGHGTGLWNGSCIIRARYR